VASITVHGFCRDTNLYDGEPYGGKGGAIATLGYAFVTDSTFTSNRAAIAGGAIAELMPAAPTGTGHVGGTYTRSTFVDSDATIAAGAILAHGTTTVLSSVFKSNRSGLKGGSAIYSNGTLNVKKSTFGRNAVIFATAQINILGDGAGAISGNIVNVTTSTFDRNTGAIYGGAIGAVTANVAYSVFTNNRALLTGGAITASDIMVKRSRFTSNVAEFPLAQVSGLGAHGGGAIFVCNSLVVDYSTFTRNSTKAQYANDPWLGEGGAIAGYGSSVKIRHSSFTGNTASGRGGAISLGQNHELGMTPVTLWRNQFSSNVSGSYGGAVDLQSTTAAALLASRYNSFVGNRARTGGPVLSVFISGGITQADVNTFARRNTRRGNSGPGANLRLLANMPG
jgi:predicted outer membrane repeat protein